MVATRKAKTDAACCVTGPVALPTDASAETLAKLAWAIAHPARVRILRLLISRASCICGEIVDELPLAQSTVSQHLKILKDSGLVQGEVDGPKVCYCINADRLNELKSLVTSL
ncbi:MAG: metalloregulator ArsR/SmtB family transcription factor [Planctomycetaceae bacterium]